MHVAILTGFDRSGSTAISRALATHPRVELFMQPFNSGPIRRHLYEVMTDDLAGEETISFFNNLAGGYLDRSYIKSPWFESQSTAAQLVPGSVNILKSTLTHFATDWIRTRWPSLHQWIIWRDPIEILASLVRNGFHLKWYNDAFPTLLDTIYSVPFLEAILGKTAAEARGPVEQCAVVIAARVYFQLHYGSREQLIKYSTFVQSPRGGLARFFEYYGLDESIDSNMIVAQDLNLIGAAYQPNVSHVDVIPQENRQSVLSMFEPLNEAYLRLVSIH